MNEISVSPPTLGNAQRKIFSAYLQLVEEKSIDKITVSEICEIANINRSTFYRHYYDIYDLDEKVETYFLNSFIAFGSMYNFGLSAEDADASYLYFKCFNFQELDRELLTAIQKHLNTNRKFAETAFKRLIETVPTYLDEEWRNNKTVNNILKFIINGAVYYYLANNTEELSYEVYCELVKIASYIIYTFLDKLRTDSKLSAPTVKSDDPIIPIQKRERLSVMKTKRSLRNTFMELCRKKDIEKITVSELCEKAEVSHSTFYNHYKSIPDFVESVQNEIIEVGVKIGLGLYRSLDDGVLDISELSTFIGICKKLMNGLSGFDNLILRFPKEFSKKFYSHIAETYNCHFDRRITFELICYCAYFSIFQSCDGENMSLETAFELAYNMVICLFYKKSDEE